MSATEFLTTIISLCVFMLGTVLAVVWYLGGRIDTRLDGIDARLGGIDVRLDGIDGRIDGMGDRLDARIDGMGDRLDARIDALGDRLGAQIDRVDARIDGLKDEVHEMRGEIDRIGQRLDDHIVNHPGPTATSPADH